MTKEKAIKIAQERYGPLASAFIIAGVRYVSTDPHRSKLGQGWLHFDGQGKTWTEAFEDAAKNLQSIAEEKP